MLQFLYAALGSGSSTKDGRVIVCRSFADPDLARAAAFT
jgi:hypothetical protein